MMENNWKDNLGSKIDNLHATDDGEENQWNGNKLQQSDEYGSKWIDPANGKFIPAHSARDKRVDDSQN